MTGLNLTSLYKGALCIFLTVALPFSALAESDCEVKLSPIEFLSLSAMRFSNPYHVVGLHTVATKLSKDPENKTLWDEFFKIAGSLSGYSRHFKDIGNAYDRVLSVIKQGHLNFIHLEKFVQLLHTVEFEYYLRPTSSANHGVQNYLADLILNEIKNDPTFSPEEALQLVQQLGEVDIRFDTAAGFPGRWILGEILKVTQNSQKNVRVVEDAILAGIENSQTFEERFAIYSGIKKYARKYRITSRLLDAAKSHFAHWASEISHFAPSEESVSITRQNLDMELLQRHAKRVATFREFLLEANERRQEGVLLGVNTVMYDLVAGFGGITPFTTAYHSLFMTYNMDGLSTEQEVEKTRRFMNRLVNSGKQIYFLVPTNPDDTFYTNEELRFLLEDPSRMVNVTFVLGAFFKE